MTVVVKCVHGASSVLTDRQIAVVVVECLLDVDAVVGESLVVSNVR